MLCSGQISRKFSETTGPTEAKEIVAPPSGRKKRWKAYSNDLGHLLLFIIVNPGGGGGGQGQLAEISSTNLAPQFRAFSRALKMEKLNAPLFPGPEGAGDTND